MGMGVEMERVSPGVEAELRKLADQVVSIFELAGIPALVMELEPTFAGVVVMVDAYEPDAGVYVHWSSSDTLYVAGKQARDRLDMQDRANRFHAKLGDVMEETLIKVLEAAGLRATSDEWHVRVEGPVPDYLIALIEA
jgi:hypothetical protein